MRTHVAVVLAVLFSAVGHARGADLGRRRDRSTPPHVRSAAPISTVSDKNNPFTSFVCPPFATSMDNILIPETIPASLHAIAQFPSSFRNAEFTASLTTGTASNGQRTSSGVSSPPSGKLFGSVRGIQVPFTYELKTAAGRDFDGKVIALAVTFPGTKRRAVNLDCPLGGREGRGTTKRFPCEVVSGVMATDEKISVEATLYTSRLPLFFYISKPTFKAILSVGNKKEKKFDLDKAKVTIPPHVSASVYINDDEIGVEFMGTGGKGITVSKFLMWTSIKKLAWSFKEAKLITEGGVLSRVAGWFAQTFFLKSFVPEVMRKPGYHPHNDADLVRRLRSIMGGEDAEEVAKPPPRSSRRSRKGRNWVAPSRSTEAEKMYDDISTSDLYDMFGRCVINKTCGDWPALTRNALSVAARRVDSKEANRMIREIYTYFTSKDLGFRFDVNTRALENRDSCFTFTDDAMIRLRRGSRVGLAVNVEVPRDNSNKPAIGMFDLLNRATVSEFTLYSPVGGIAGPPSILPVDIRPKAPVVNGEVRIAKLEISSLSTSRTDILSEARATYTFAQGGLTLFTSIATTDSLSFESMWTTLSQLRDMRRSSFGDGSSVITPTEDEADASDAPMQCSGFMGTIVEMASGELNRVQYREAETVPSGEEEEEGEEENAEEQEEQEETPGSAATEPGPDSGEGSGDGSTDEERADLLLSFASIRRDYKKHYPRSCLTPEAHVLAKANALAYQNPSPLYVGYVGCKMRLTDLDRRSHFNTAQIHLSDFPSASGRWRGTGRVYHVDDYAGGVHRLTPIASFLSSEGEADDVQTYMWEVKPPRGRPYVAYVFRGSDSSEDWCANLNMQKTNGEGNLPGPVHRGMLGHWRAVSDRVMRKLRTYKSTHRIVVSGHSLGAGAAVIAAYEIAEDLYGDDRPNMSVYLFGTPRSVSPKFAKAFDIKLGGATFNYITSFKTCVMGMHLPGKDLVSQVPPRSMGYSTIGAIAGHSNKATLCLAQCSLQCPSAMCGTVAAEKECPFSTSMALCHGPREYADSFVIADNFENGGTSSLATLAKARHALLDKSKSFCVSESDESSAPEIVTADSSQVSEEPTTSTSTSTSTSTATATSTSTTTTTTSTSTSTEEAPTVAASQTTAREHEATASEAASLADRDSVTAASEATSAEALANAVLSGAKEAVGDKDKA